MTIALKFYAIPEIRKKRKHKKKNRRQLPLPILVASDPLPFSKEMYRLEEGSPVFKGQVKSLICN